VTDLGIYRASDLCVCVEGVAWDLHRGRQKCFSSLPLFSRLRNPCFQTVVHLNKQNTHHVGYIVGTNLTPIPKTFGTTGFEPATYCSQSSRATKLRYVPTISLYHDEKAVKIPKMLAEKGFWGFCHLCVFLC
jgi:hypothetical protein